MSCIFFSAYVDVFIFLHSLLEMSMLSNFFKKSCTLYGNIQVLIKESTYLSRIQDILKHLNSERVIGYLKIKQTIIISEWTC